MPFDLNELEAAVLALPPEQRGYLVERLLASLDDAIDWNDRVEVERGWIEEAESRYQEYLAGGVETILAPEALAQVRAELGSVGIGGSGGSPGG